jgi:hypothetical protein
MRNYNHELIDTQYALIEVFLFKADKSVLDISYSIADKQITIQIVLLERCSLSQESIENVKEKLSSFDVIIKELYLTKKQFNKSKGEWQPQYYRWLDYLLFSKAEVL